MKRDSKPAGGPDETELVHIQLDSLDREFDSDLGCPIYETVFSCSGPEGHAEAFITVVAGEVTTLDIVPQAMSDLHRLFAVLAEQTRAWRIDPKA